MPDINQINLIPADIIEERIIRDKTRKGIIFILSLILCFIAIGVNEHVYMTRLEKEVSMLRNNDNKLKILEKEFIVNDRDVKDLLEKKVNLSNLVEKSCLTPVLLDLAKIINPSTRLTKFSIGKNPTDNDKKPDTNIIRTLGGISKSYIFLGL